VRVKERQSDVMGNVEKLLHPAPTTFTFPRLLATSPISPLRLPFLNPPLCTLSRSLVRSMVGIFYSLHPSTQPSVCSCSYPFLLHHSSCTLSFPHSQSPLRSLHPPSFAPSTSPFSLGLNLARPTQARYRTHSAVTRKHKTIGKSRQHG
jgi:hypothetical protein